MLLRSIKIIPKKPHVTQFLVFVDDNLVHIPLQEYRVIAFLVRFEWPIEGFYFDLLQVQLQKKVNQHL